MKKLYHNSDLPNSKQEKQTPLQITTLLLSKSPESATTVVYFLSCSRAEAISTALFLAKSRG